MGEALSSLGRQASFSLDQDDRYRQWRKSKLEATTRSRPTAVVTIGDPRQLARGEYLALTRTCADLNFVLYQVADPPRVGKTGLRMLGAQLGLSRMDHNPLADEDSITSLKVARQGPRMGYIPYSDRRLVWHTDGYYNHAENRVHGFIMHCVRPAASGGENEVIDHEMVYMLMRDDDAECVRALMHPQAMTIPGNTTIDDYRRSARSGPVFYVDHASGTLHMRYSARSRNIQWRQDTITRKANALLEDILRSRCGYKFRFRLDQGQGLICNNVPHRRDEFVDDRDHARLLYRARFLDRVNKPESERCSG